MERREQGIHGGMLFRFWKEHVSLFNKDNGFITNMLLENLVTSA